jgi:type II secretory pathway pseudopilin PulG
MVVVIGIILVLVGILLPSVNRARRNASRARIAFDLQSISTALEAYKQDHGDHPRVTGAPDATKVGYDGAIALCQALIAPGKPDDLDPSPAPALPGFRTQPGSKVYGPYLPTDHFMTAHPTDPANVDPTHFVILDRFEKPVLYFPASPARPNVRIAPVSPGLAAAPYVDASTTPSSDFSRYDARDNYVATSPPFGPFERQAADGANVLLRMRLMLGDLHGATTGTPPDGVLQADEAEVNAPYLLWSAGPDGLFGPNADAAGDRNAVDQPDVAACDDVTNFR